jgi:hypothetical protein
LALACLGFAAAVGLATDGSAVSTPSDTIRLTDDQGNTLLQFGGQPAEATIDEATEGANGATVTFTMVAPFDPFGIPNGLVKLYEPESGLESDVVTVSRMDAQLILVTFHSDAEAAGVPCDPGPNGICLAETGQVQNLTSPLFSGAGVPFQVLVQSDVGEVPEPGMATLVGGGVATLAIVRRRRRDGQARASS